jgi:quercetin dioxygenase-like cupin family protein
MKGSTQFILGALLTLLVLAFAAPLAQAQDIVKVAPQNCKVVLENERVRVIEVVAKPGEKIPMHSHPAHLLYALSAGKMATAFTDGKSATAEIKIGDVRWLDPVTHANENTGTTEIRALVVELKEPVKEQK